MRCCFESGGWDRLYREHHQRVALELAERHQEELCAVRWWRRFGVQRRQRAEIARLARARMPSDGASFECE
ncbi:MAG: hypothetical protein JNM84_02620 [Planctomycetes bacterium]|nr:hypothetical protein [Planctomycetota bacterium]